MTDPNVPAERNPLVNAQMGNLVYFFVRTKKLIPLILILGILCAVVAGWYVLSSRQTTYAASAVGLVSSPPIFHVQLTPTADSQPGWIGDFRPEPLSVPDFALLLKAEPVLKEVVDQFNAFPATGTPVSRESLVDSLAVDYKLELKTPYALRYHGAYEVKYFATLDMHAIASTPDEAIALCGIWTEVARDYLNEQSRTVRRELHESVTRELETALKSLAVLEKAAADVGQSSNGRHAAFELELARERAQILSRIQVQTQLLQSYAKPEFEIVSPPIRAVHDESGLPYGLIPIVFVVVTAAAWTILVLVLSFTSAYRHFSESTSGG